MKVLTPLFILSVMLLCPQFEADAKDVKDSSNQNIAAVKKEDPAARKFVRDCSSCHTIGGGKLKGPDLIQAVTWNRDDLGKAIKKMEKEVGELPDPVISALIDLMKDGNRLQRLNDEEQRQIQARRALLAPPDAAKGYKLFWGTEAFVNRGLPCASCHKAGGIGGMLGPDLTSVYEKMGEVALISGTEKAAYKVMEPHYRTKPVTAQEAVHLAAYFKQLSLTQPAAEYSFHPLSLLAAIGLIFGIVVLYKSAESKRSSTRKK